MLLVGGNPEMENLFLPLIEIDTESLFQEEKDELQGDYKSKNYFT